MCFDQLNLTTNASIAIVAIVGLDLEKNMFDVRILIE